MCEGAIVSLVLYAVIVDTDAHDADVIFYSSLLSQGAIAAVHFMITSAAQYDLDDRVLIQEIQQLGLPKENSETICKQYRETKDRLRAKLENSSYRVSKLTATDWRVDQVLASSADPKANTSHRVVHVNMNVDTEPNASDISPLRFQDVSFVMDAEQLDLLVHELAQAQHLMQSLE
jgi:COMM domain containing 4